MKKKWSYYYAGYLFLVTHPGTNPSKQGSTLLSGRHVVLSLWYSDSERNCFKFLRWEKVTKREKITDIGWENKEQKNGRNENENYYLFWWSDNKQGLRSLLLSRSLGPITSWSFQQYSLTVAFLHYFFIMPVGFKDDFQSVLRSLRT